jgi:hypothetical protein
MLFSPAEAGFIAVQYHHTDVRLFFSFSEAVAALVSSERLPAADAPLAAQLWTLFTMWDTKRDNVICMSGNRPGPSVAVAAHVEGTYAANVMAWSSTNGAHAPTELTTLPKVETSCTILSLIPTVNGNTVRSFYYARTTVRGQGSSTTVPRSDDIQLT